MVDSSPIQQYLYKLQPSTITINPSGPLTIRTTSLLDGTVGTAYQGQLVATGGSPPLVWTVTAGALPAGLALNPTTGAISGIPTATPGTYSFTVEVADTSSPQETSTQPLSITINAAAAACSSSGNNSLLAGQYAFSLRGYNGAGFLAVVGSFTADGNGDITAGEADTNGVLGAQNGNLITSASSYSVGPDNRGCATLATPFGTFYTRFALGAVSAGVATQGRIIEFDNPGASAYIAAGQILQQNATAFLSPLTGSYALRTAGWDPVHFRPLRLRGDCDRAPSTSSVSWNKTATITERLPIRPIPARRPTRLSTPIPPPTRMGGAPGLFPWGKAPPTSRSTGYPARNSSWSTPIPAPPLVGIGSRKGAARQLRL